jgi:hypothetical protein
MKEINYKLLLTCVAFLFAFTGKAQRVTTIVGNGTAGFSGDGGQATAAEISLPGDMAFDAAGNLYIADAGNNRIRKVNTSGVISTIAGNGTAGYSGDGGQATAAELSGPQDAVLDASGNLYITDFANHRVRKVNTSGVISTIAGTGTGGSSGDGGQATAAKIGGPSGLEFDASGNLYIADRNQNCQNFIINLDELAALSKMDLNGLKSMLSRDYVKVRLPYDRKATVHKRRASFFGSTNKDEFLNDETGSVRWLCHEILKINWDYKKDLDINLIWAQALALFNSDFKYELTAKEIEENENANAQHQLRSPELEYLTAHFVPAAKGGLLVEAMTATSIINRLREANLTSMNLNVTNMGKALRMAGYTQTTERMGENKVPTKIYFLRFYPTTLTTNV